MWYHYEKKMPKSIKGGIKAESRRGSFGKEWWGLQWINALESFSNANRLSRGRSYARKGQVTAIQINHGCVEATVQGTRADPYEVVIELETLKENDWKKVAEIISQQALYSAKLLSNEMPRDMETVFASLGLSLFPKGSREIHTDCSCPDWSNPCKHVAAVYYLIAEEFDRNPFLIFKLRGIERDDFLKLIGQHASDAESPRSIKEEDTPLESDIKAFWKGDPKDFGPVHIPEPLFEHALLPQSLGKFPLWRGELPFLETLQKIYKSASVNTRKLL